MPLRDARTDGQASPDVPMREPQTRTMPADTLPLFTGASLDDEPLVRFPAPPRPPLAVRRTPDLPRPRQATMVTRRAQATEDASPVDLRGRAERRPNGDSASISTRVTARVAPTAMEPCSAGARIGAAFLDLAILLAIDLLVVYFTLRMAALTPGEWRLLPPVPLGLFLLLLNVAYAVAFTAIGGQTIGKMATRIRVVSDEGPMVTPALAFRRTLGAAVSILTLGGTFLPALIGRERRAVHDRVARTRVVALPVA
jgi:uncharacterized RDD family membrane protein YckC